MSGQTGDNMTVTASDVAPASDVLTAPTAEDLGYRVIGPDPDHDGWTLIEVTCANCGAANQIHEQPEEYWTDPIENRHPVDGRHLGLVWECSTCSARNNLGGEAPRRPDTYVLECSNCHSTFAPSTVTETPDGTWTCRVCDTENRDVHAGDSGAGASAGAVGT